MAEHIFFLPMTHARVRLEMRHPDWWEWTLIVNEMTTILGAESIEGIGRRIIERLSARGEGESAGEVDGRNVYWVFSLSERHYSLYCAVNGADRLLYFEDADGHTMWRDLLSPEHLERWTEVLDEIVGDGRHG